MEHVPGLEQSLYGIGAIVLSVAAAIGILMKTTTRSYGTIVDALTKQNELQQVQLNSQQKQISILRRGRKRDRANAKMVEDKCQKDMAHLQEEMATMRRQCPILSGEASCPIAECPVHDPKLDVHKEHK